jgi:L-threonylcarbamoyladenylate synthase
METVILPSATKEEMAVVVDRAVALLREGEVVALPTETVYGLAADATRADAAVKIFEAKERPFFDPLIVHLPDRSWLGRVAQFDDTMVLVDELTAAFWPGPLTLVLPRWSVVPDIVTSGLETVAVRMSAHPVFSEIVRAFGKPVAAPSANRFGRISPTTAAHVASELGGRIPLIVDGGPCAHGIESTIVRVEPEMLTILRAGPIGAEELEVFAPVSSSSSPSLQAPGQMKSHYAPRTPLVIGNASVPATGTGQRVPQWGVLAFRGIPENHGFAAVEVLSATGDMREAAATLFAKMRRLDEAGVELIVAEAVPETGLGIAIMDRLRKAAG